MSDENKPLLPISVSEQYAMWLRGEFDVPTDTYWEDQIAALEKRLAEATKFIQDIADGGGFTGAAAKDFLESTHD